MVDVNETDMKVFPKTKDLFGSCGTVFLAHKDYDVIQNNIDYLRNVEKHAFPLVLSEKILLTREICKMTWIILRN